MLTQILAYAIQNSFSSEMRQFCGTGAICQRDNGYLSVSVCTDLILTGNAGLEMYTAGSCIF